AGVLGQQSWVARGPRLVAYRLDDRAEGADGDTLREERLQHTLDLAKRENGGDNLRNDSVVGFLLLNHKVAYVLPPGPARGGGAGWRMVSGGWFTITDSPSTTVYPSASASACWTSGIQIAGSPNAGSVVGIPDSLPTASPGSMPRWWPAMIMPRATTVPRTLT